MVSGVAQVDVWGAAKYAVRVQVDPDKLAATAHRAERGGPGAAALERQHADWYALRRTTAYTLRATGQLFNAAAYPQIVVAWRNGTPVRLAQVANVIDGVEDDKNAHMSYEKTALAAPST